MEKGFMSNIPIPFEPLQETAQKVLQYKVRSQDWIVFHPLQFLKVTTSSHYIEAAGIDQELEGYDKNGSEIQKLKVNGALALFFVANEEQNDLALEIEPADK